MKKYLSFLIIILCPLFVFGQNVGVGTLNPLFPLQINDEFNAGPSYINISTSGRNSAPAGVTRISGIQLKHFDNLNWGFTLESREGTTSQGFVIKSHTGTPAGIERLFIDRESGNIGINTIEPSEKLHVSGNLKVAGIISGVSDPVSAQDAATKAYVDGEIASLPTITTYAIGDFAQGGIVFWLDETGQHGLVCAKSDQSSAIRWYAGTNGNTRAKGDGVYAGEANTTIIISSQVAIGDDDSPYAAQLCNDLQITEGGTTYGDWYLPSKYELNLMYQNKVTIDASATANGGSGFSSSYYWSSTEFDFSSAWEQSFGGGGQLGGNKTNVSGVRGVRAF